jgi:hypothetical protein
VNEHEREQLQAEALDAYLSGRQAGRQAARPDAVPADQAGFLDALVDLAEATRPDASFASRLEARLRSAAERRAPARPAAAARHPRPRNALQGLVTTVTERLSSMNRRLVLSTAGVAILALVLFTALVLLTRNKPVGGPGQVAQQPTSTSTAVHLPTATPTAPAQEVRPPSATPQETVLPTAGPTTAPQETVLPTAGPTVVPQETALPTAVARERIALPPLAEWSAGGYGGGGMGGPPPSKRTYVLGTALPEGPAQMTVYMQREPVRLTASYGAQMAERLGLQGQVYQSIALASSANPDEETFRGYLAVDGAREVMFESAGIVHYTDRNRTSFHEGYWSMPEGVPPLAQAVSSAEAFLRSAGLLEGEYEIAATGDTLSFYHVLEGQWLLVEPFARVTMWGDGQVGQAQVWPLALDVLAEYPVISAQEAWQILSSGQPDGRVWQNPYRAADMPPWGEWSDLVVQNMPRLWVRSYSAGQQMHRFGIPRVWFSTKEGGAPFVAIGDLVLTGDVGPLTEYVLKQYAQGQWMYVHVWGEVQEEGDVQTLRLEGWEPAEETFWSGTIQRQDGQGMLVTGDGRTIQVPDLPAEVTDGTQVSVSGGQYGDRLEWSLIQEMSYAVPPAAGTASEVQMTVDQVDLVYLALAPNVIPAERFSDLGLRAVQPVWRFRGHSDSGGAFEVYVQAVSEAYVGDHP